MVKLSAMTVEGESGVDLVVRRFDEAERMVCGIPARPIKILLTTDMSQTTGVDEYQDGANVDAYVDRDGDVFVLIDDGKDICYLEAEEFTELVNLVKGMEPEPESEQEQEPEPATEPTDEPAAEPEPDPMPPAVRSQWAARLAHEREIADASANVATCAVEWTRCLEAAKSAKKSFDGAVEDLRSIIGRGAEVMPLFDRQPADAKQAATASPTGDTSTSTSTDDAWKATPIDVLFPDIERFGEKKQDAVRELIPTLGAFEELRKRASLEGEPLKSLMPKGVGQDSCDQLEEAALNWIAKHQYITADGTVE